MSTRKFRAGMAAVLILGIVALFFIVGGGLAQGPSLPPGVYDLEEGKYVFNVPELAPTSTPVPAPTDTPVLPPTDTPVPSHPDSWHPPETHEHGDAPPQWVLDSPLSASFVGMRGIHPGFKGAYVLDYIPGTEQYLLVHILSTPAARLTQFHSYKMWFLDETGAVSYWEGFINAGDPNAPDARISRGQIGDDDIPRILVIDHLASASFSSEQWYTRAAEKWGWEIIWRVGRVNYFANLPESFDQSTWELFPEPNFGLRRTFSTGIWVRAEMERNGLPFDQEFCSDGFGLILDCSTPDVLRTYVASTMPVGEGSSERVLVSGAEKKHVCPLCEVPN